ncbi:MAG: hypothetical protein P8Z42_02235 [Anaerolineales bacterium]
MACRAGPPTSDSSPIITECASERAADHAGNCKNQENQTNGCHPDVEFTREVEREEWEKQRPANVIDKGGADERPEVPGIFIYDCSQTAKWSHECLVFSVRKKIHPDELTSNSTTTETGLARYGIIPINI